MLVASAQLRYAAQCASQACPPSGSQTRRPAGARPYLVSQKFQARTTDDLPCGTTAVTDEGSIYGLSPFVQMSGADAGDLLIIEFDIAGKGALLRLGDEELLESYGT